MVTKLHGTDTMKNLRVKLNAESLSWLGLKNGKTKVTDRPIRINDPSDKHLVCFANRSRALPMTTLYLDVSHVNELLEK